MERNSHKLRDLLLYGGTSKEEFEQIRPLIVSRDLTTWQVTSVVLEILFLVLFIISIINPTYVTFTPYFGILSVYTIILVLVLLLAAKQLSRWLLPLLYVSLVVIYVTLLLMVCLSDASRNLGTALVFPTILMALSFLLVDRPFRPALLFVFFGGAFTIWQAIINASNLGTDIALAKLYHDIIIGVIATFASVAFTIYTNFVSFRRLATTYKTEQERDTDALTGVKNAIAYDRAVVNLTNIIKHKSDAKFALVVCDINGLKYINDNYGHKQGDDLIVRAASLLKESFPNSNIYRIGGDEFVVIVGDGDYINRDHTLRSLKERVEEIHKNASSPLEDTSIALGISTYSRQNDYDYVTIFSRADADMYNNKHLIKSKLNLNKE